MTYSLGVEKIYECKKCTCRFENPLRVSSDEGEYNACRRCGSLHIKSIFKVDGAGEFEREFEACRAKEDCV